MSGRMKWLILALFVGLLAPASAAPTPIPGGANGVSAVSGKVGTTVFNGMLRIKITALREASAAEASASMVSANAGQKILYIESLLGNGTHDEFTDLLQYTLADKDAISVVIPTNVLTHANLHILQGAAQRQTGAFVVDKDFVPTKLIVICSTCGVRSAFRAVRFTVPAQ